MILGKGLVSDEDASCAPGVKCFFIHYQGYKPQFTREVFETVAIATRKPPTYTIKDEQGEVIQGKFYQKELIKVI